MEIDNQQTQNKKRRIILSVVVVMVLVSIILGLSYLKINKDSVPTTQIETKKIFPLESPYGSENLATLPCTITKNISSDFDFLLSDDSTKKIKVKLLTECEYLDVDMNKQKVLLITGALFNDAQGLKLSYGGNVHRDVIEDPENVTGDLIIGEIQRNKKNANNLETEPIFDSGEQLSLILSPYDNSFFDETITSIQNSLISKYTYDYLIKYWDNQSQFWQSGNIEYLPDSPNGKILPVLGIVWK